MRMNLIAVLALCAGTVFAQDALTVASGLKVDVGTDIGVEDPDLQIWKFKIGAGFDMHGGNTESDGYNGHFEVVKDGARFNFRFTADGAYGLQETALEDGTKKDERTSANANGVSNFKFLIDKSFLFTDFSASHDDVADLRYRLIESFGIGRFLIKEDELKISLQTGLACVQEELDAKDEYLGARIAERIDWIPSFADKVVFFETVEGILDFDDTDHYLINGETGVEIPLFENLSIDFKYVLNYNSSPADGKESCDRQCVAQLSYRF